MQPNSRISVNLAGAALLGLASIAVVHGHDDSIGRHMPEMSSSRPTIISSANATDPESYWQYGEHSGMMAAHIFLMSVAWVFVLPIGKMSLGELGVSVDFRRCDAFDFAIPLFSPNPIRLSRNQYRGSPLGHNIQCHYSRFLSDNAHHKIGWIATWVTSAQLLMAVVAAYAGRRKHGAFLPVSTDAMEEHQRRQNIENHETYRFSQDSGQGTEPNTESLRSQSISSQNSDHLPAVRSHHEEDDELEEKHDLLHGSKVDQFLTRKIPGLRSSLLRIFKFLINVIDRTILILGFVALATGILTYGGFFMGDRVFSGLAHWIKGGKFIRILRVNNC